MNGQEKDVKSIKTHRIFETGATRDTADGKLEYANYMHPINDYSFAEYMKSKQVIGGEYRRGDNWQKGIPAESLFDSLVRHMEIVKLLEKGYSVVEIKKDGNVELKVHTKHEEKEAIEFYISLGYSFDIKYIISELNAIRFNSEALKLHYLTNAG